MKITCLILVGYRGYNLRQIHHFEYRPTTKTQIILGTNGSGKSKTLSELSPLPGLASDFTKNGRKEITIEHLGKLYVLKSLFENGTARYIFEVDGENLNPGYTLTVYRELCKTHFNYTSEVHSLLTGKTRFSSMSVAERRNWFMKISDTDYTYAIKYHNHLKEKIRDLQGALKLNQARLTQETNKCLSEKDEIELRKKITEYSLILNTLLEHRKPRLSNPIRYSERVDALDNSLRRDMERLERLLEDMDSGARVNSLSALEEASVGFQANLQSLQKEIIDRCEKLERYQKDLDVVNQTSKSSFEEIQRQLKDLEENEADLLSRIKHHFNFDNSRLALSSFEACRFDLDHILTELSLLPRLNYTREDYDQLIQDLPKLKEAIAYSSKVENECFLKKQLLEANKAKGITECPECHHSWYQDFSESQYKVAVFNHTAAVEANETNKKRLEKHQAAIDEHNLFSDLLSRYRRLVEHFDTLQPFWNYLKQTELMVKNPNAVLAEMNIFHGDIQLSVKLEQIKKQLEEVRKLESLMQNTKQLDKDKLEKEIKAENEGLINAQNETRNIHICLEQTKNKIKIISSIFEYQSNINASIKERSDALKFLIEDKCVEVLDEIIYSVKLLVSQNERTLSQVDIQRGIVKGLEEQVKLAEEDLYLLKLAQKALSPTEGLIARGMTGFINHFVKQENDFIAKIWLYPLVLIPIEITDEESLDLDYKFQVSVNNEVKPVPDISLTSAGMQEVIDLAFVATSMKYLGLANFPIFLDEFAVKLDPAHRQSAYRAIEHLIDSTDYSQVYLVSHYQEGYSSLTASEVLVLCDSNVELPDHLVYNKHAVFK